MPLQPTAFFLIFALFYLLVLSVVFLRNRVDLTSLYPGKPTSNLSKISVCIPARNEQQNIDTLLHSLERQSWLNYDVHILDDQSDEDTYKVAKNYQEKHPGKFFAHKGEEKPDGWMGKPWACYQLSKKSNGQILLFLDADTVAEPSLLEKISSSMEHYRLDMLTVWPKQKMVTAWEQILIPLVFYTLLTLLPVIYVYRDPHWMPSLLKKRFSPKFAVACGQCIAVTRKAYQTVGGHESVKNEVLEDVKLAQRIKEKGFVLRMFDGMESISCRMYRNEKEIFNGLRKNFLAGFSHSIPAFIIAAILHLIVFVLPFITLFISVFIANPLLFFLSVASVSLVLLQRLILSKWYHMNPVYSLTHPLAVMWFQRLAIVKIWDHLKGNKVSWKGREI